MSEAGAIPDVARMWPVRGKVANKRHIAVLTLRLVRHNLADRDAKAGNRPPHHDADSSHISILWRDTGFFSLQIYSSKFMEIVWVRYICRS